MLTVVLLAPYSFSEETAIALRIADDLLQQGCRVVYYAEPRKDGGGIDGLWDSKCRGNREHFGGQVLFKPEGLHAVVHVGYRPAFPSELYWLIPKSKQVLVPLWHTFQYSADDFDAFDTILCPSRNCLSALKVCPDLTVSHKKKIRSVLPVSLAEGIFQADLVKPEQAAVLMPLRSRSVDAMGPIVPYALRTLLQSKPFLSFHLLSAKSWPQPIRESLLELVGEYADRFRFSHWPSREHYRAHLAASDLLLDLNIRSNSALDLSESLAAGTPAILYDIAPNNELGNRNIGCELLRCDIRVNQLGAPEVLPDLGDLLLQLDELLTLDEIRRLRSRLCARIGLSVPRASFRKILRESLELPYRDV